VLLAGLLRCGHCGRKLQVHYSGKIGRYNCYGAHLNHGTARCISIGARSTDAAVSAEVLRLLGPLGMEAAVKALDIQAETASAAERPRPLLSSKWRPAKTCCASGGRSRPGTMISPQTSLLFQPSA
jgi:hypothetical protein